MDKEQKVSITYDQPGKEKSWHPYRAKVVVTTAYWSFHPPVGKLMEEEAAMLLPFIRWTAEQVEHEAYLFDTKLDGGMCNFSIPSAPWAKDIQLINTICTPTYRAIELSIFFARKEDQALFKLQWGETLEAKD